MLRRKGTVKLEDNSQGGPWRMVFIILILMLVLAGGAYLFFFTDLFTAGMFDSSGTAAEPTKVPSSQSSIVLEEEDTTANPTETSPTPASNNETEEMTPTATPVIDLGIYTITVLNGNGVAGSAGEVQGLLETGGFTVSSTGNADNWSYTDSVIRVKTSVPEVVISKLKDALNATYTTVVKQDLEATSTNDIEVVVGVKK